VAIVEGGILGNPRGKTGGVVFGAARSRNGKVVTARQKVTPANPQTAAQTAQRNKFATALDGVRQAGPDIYSVDWNRSIGQLPGFQSLQSIFLGAIQPGDTFVAPADTPLGKLHYPLQFTVDPGVASGEIDLAWSSEAGEIGEGTDGLVVMAMRVEIQEKKSEMLTSLEVVDRDEQSLTLSGLEAGADYLVGTYLRGSAANVGTNSLARWFTVTATA